MTGTCSSLSVRCGSLSGASNGSDVGSGISMTLTGLLVNPMTQPSFFTVTNNGVHEAISYCLYFPGLR